MKLTKKFLSVLLTLCVLAGSIPGMSPATSAAVSAGINDMTALDALGIDITVAPKGFDPNTPSNPFGRETTTIASVDELFMTGKASNDTYAYSRLHGDNWAVGGSASSFFSSSPQAVGNATTGSLWVYANPFDNSDSLTTGRTPYATAMTEANFDLSKTNGGKKDSALRIAFKEFNGSAMQVSYIKPRSQKESARYPVGSGPTDVHDNRHFISLGEMGGSFFNKEDLASDALANQKFRSEHAASQYLKIATGDFDGDGVDEFAVYSPVRNNPHIIIYKFVHNGLSAQPIMTYQLDSYKATKHAAGGGVSTSVGDTLIPNAVSLVADDFDMDGIDDLAISYGYNGLAMDAAPCKAIMLFGAEAGKIGLRRQEVPLSHGGVSVIRASFASGDVDGDQKNELVVGGSVNSVTFDSNERYVAIYKWNGKQFVISQSKNFDPFEKDDNGNHVNTNVPADKTIYHSLPILPANIAVGRFNGVGNPMSIYIDSMLISLGDDGMELSGMLDDTITDRANY